MRDSGSYDDFLSLFRFGVFFSRNQDLFQDSLKPIYYLGFVYLFLAHAGEAESAEVFGIE